MSDLNQVAEEVKAGLKINGVAEVLACVQIGIAIADNAINNK
jgi:hypothetical protein